MSKPTVRHIASLSTFMGHPTKENKRPSGRKQMKASRGNGMTPKKYRPL